MMMLGDKKKAISVILGALLGTSDQPKKDDKPEEEPKYGMEAAMQKFIDAVHDKDVDKAIEAFCECKEMSSGYEYYKE